jgi:type VII secretion system (Wss) protein YukD
MTTADTSHGQQTVAGGHGGNHPFKVTVRTLAGHHMSETMKPDHTVAELTAKAVKHFVAKGELTEGDYALTLPRTGGEAELDPTATLHDAGVVDGDVLVLVNRKPQVDG